MRAEGNRVQDASFRRSLWLIAIVGLTQAGCTTPFAPRPPGELPDCEFPPSTEQCHAARTGPPEEGLRFTEMEH
jgi:hypothetical protein